MRWIFSRNFSYNKYRKYYIWKLFYLINNYIYYIIISNDWLYINNFKRKKVITSESNTPKGLVNHRFNSPFKPNVSKLSSRSFSTVNNSLKTGVSDELLSSLNQFSRQVSGNNPSEEQMNEISDPFKVKAKSDEKISTNLANSMPLTFNYDSERKFNTSAIPKVTKRLDP